MRLPASLVALTLLLAACGSDTETPAGEGPPSSPGAPAEKPAGTKDKNTVVMKDIEFKPSELTVKVGTPVTWVNEESIEHDTVSETGEWKSELFGQGGSYRYMPDKAGTFKYVCSVHPGMEGTLKVTE